LDYRKRFGDCCIPFLWPEKRWLASWVAKMRNHKKRNLLTEAQVRELDQIGFVWSVDLRRFWEQHFKDLEAFKKKHGHCNVPRNYPPNRALAFWVDRLRLSKKNGKLDKNTIRRLNGLGFRWSLLHRRFHRRDLDEFVAILAAFKKRHGHCNLIAARAGLDPDLAGWLKDVRKSKKQGRLDPKRIRQLDRLGFAWEPRKLCRQAMLSALLAYRKRYGNCRVAEKWPKNRSLASWVARMRNYKRRNLLTREQIQELDQIGFTWCTDRQHAWDQQFKELQAFKKKYGHCNVPVKSSLNPALGRWVASLRGQKRRGTLAKDRIRRLAALGFCWDMRKRKKKPRKPKKLKAKLR
jgi:hypothetical protein